MATEKNTGNRGHHFSFIESLNREERDPYRDRHFEQVIKDIAALEQWMKENNIQNNWDLTEKLAFLRNVEANIRTGTAVRRTQLSWFALASATFGTLLGFLIGISS